MKQLVDCDKLQVELRYKILEYWEHLCRLVAFGFKLALSKGHFTHGAESLWPSQFKHSRWWKRQSGAGPSSLHTQDWEPVTSPLQALSLVETVEPAEFRSTHETESPWPVHFKHSRWWKWQSRSKFTPHTRLRARDRPTSSTLVGGKGGAAPISLHTALEGPMECVTARWMWSLQGFIHGIKWIMFHGHSDWFQIPPLGSKFNTKVGDPGTPNTHNCWFILFYHVWRPTWIKFYGTSIWLRVRSHMISHSTWRSVTILHDSGGILGWPSDTFFWALPIPWSRLLARVWSGPNLH